MLLFVGCFTEVVEKEQKQELKPKIDIKSLLWIEGIWEDTTTFGFKSPPVKLVEEWNYKNDSLTGKGYSVTDGDTTIAEYLSIVLSEGSLIYVAKSTNRNPVGFGLISSKSNAVVFENKANDFPQKISYTLNSTDSLTIQLEGINNAIARKVIFKFKGTN